MTTYYLRVEAVNLGGFIFDTQDLSTIRGGGLLLLDMVDQRLAARLKHLSPITTGASAGMFAFEDRNPQEVRDEVAKLIREDDYLTHATFVVDVVPASPDFIADRETLIARNRWRQMRQPSVAVPAWNGDALPICVKDRIRPATETMQDPEAPTDRSRDQPISASVARRRQWGVKQKRQLYRRLTEIDADYTREFGDLAGLDRDDPNRDRIPANLIDKMAVIHIDGNAFGKVQDRTASTREAQKTFDEKLKTKRNDLLKSHLEAIGADPTWRTKDGRYRIETLLWGGDEIVWIVPAWKGWEMLQRTFELTRGWKTDWTDPAHPLTHAAGLVFCHHKAPIHRVKGLASDLVDKAKARGRDANRFAYAVLESFDHISEGMESYWGARRPKDLPAEAACKEWVLPAEAMGTILDVVRRLQKSFPRRKLYQIVREWIDRPDDAGRTTKATWESLPRDAATTKLREDLERAFGLTDLRWFHLAELWDYVVDTRPEAEKQP